MAEPLLHDIERDALAELLRLAEERRRRGEEITSAFQAARDAAEREVNRARRQLAAARDREVEALEAARESELRQLAGRRDEEVEAAHRFNAEQRRAILTRTGAELDAARTALHDAVWTADSVLEAGEREARAQRDTLLYKLAAVPERAGAVWAAAEPRLAQLGLADEVAAALGPGAGLPPGTSEADLEGAFARAEAARARLLRPRLPRLLGAAGTAALLALFAGLAALAGGLAGGQGGALLGLAAGLVLALPARLALRWLARRQARVAGYELARSLARAGQVAERLAAEAEEACAAQLAALKRRHAAERAAAEAKYEPRIRRAEERRRAALAEHDAEYNRRLEAAHESHARDHAEAARRYEEARAACLARCEEQLRQAEETFERRSAEALDERDRASAEMERRWREGLDRVRAAFAELARAGAEDFPPWESPAWGEPRPAERVLPGVRFGELTVDWHRLGLGPVMDRYDWADDPAVLPAFLPFPQRGSLLLRAGDQGRAAAVRALQNLMLRFLTAAPPGKVRFTVIDPVGLGDNFASFMHLADYDEALVSHRIWTEPDQVEQRLEDLTAHMENVIQKYLRNQYKSIEEYNAEAGEVAEPLRVLVVANFPVNFSPEAARRLVSIASSGPGCGVYTLVHVDPKQPMPQGFRLADLEQACPNLVWKQDRLQWKDGPLAQFPLEVEAPPPPEQLARLVRWVGERSRDAKRVEVPFEFIAPEEEEIWAGDSRRGISVPLGRAGATKRQRLELGQGTSQHVVIAGKTGSGKSTLLHALVTSAALRYSPDEVELYLIDFKKGVEFKAYAAHKLPHARVIAIESEREFGLSVLQRLDAELKQRGDRFRDAGVNDLAGYREARPAERCPRILLIVDEFQEFFTEDDKLAQEAGLLLDRLVRQGRAFGLHVLLGSQTLGGAYSLARSTIDQMAVRIALQCSEADAQLVLNRDNSAARLLSRPGEAIYNDANGAVEGNDIFQVVWLSDATRDRWLRRLEGRGWSGSGGHAPIVFEGSAPAELEHNPLLRRLLEAPGWPEDVRAASGWLGEAVAIKDPTAALFRPMSGNNLLVIGQHEEAARAVLSAALISLAAQHAPSEATPARFHVLDGTAPDDPRSGHLTEVTAVLPHAVRWVERGEVGAALGELAAEVERRQQDPDVPRDAVYLFVHGLQRFRDLRRDEDDFGFARRGGERQVSPSEHLLMLLREGPAVGVHLILWCDSLTNLNRSLDRPSLRECGMRVLFQMGAGDSSHLIDSPLAARLGRYRALFYHEELGLIEKFRPYGLPRRAWLEEVGRRLHRRVAARVG